MFGRILTPRRLAVAGLCLVALAGSCLLAWWQWTRYETGGSLQNLGYVLQWPLFGLFPAFMVWRIHRLATKDKREAGKRGAITSPAEPEAEQHVPSVTPAASRSRLGYVAPRRSAGDQDDPVLAEYNRYLTELNEKFRPAAGEDDHVR